MSIDKSLAEKFENDNDWENALTEYKRLLIENPKANSIIEKVGWCQSRLGLYDDAIDTYKELTINEPKKAKWDYTVGYQYYSKKEWDLAIEWFKKALSKYPDYFIVKYRLGYALTQSCGSMFKLQKKEYLEAFKEFEECENLYEQMSDSNKLREKAHYADVCFQKGKILLERSNWDAAIDVFKKAISINIEGQDIKYNLAKAYVGKQGYQEAYDLVKNLKGKYYYEELKAEALTGLEKYNDAEEIYIRLLDKRKRDYIYRELSNTYLLDREYKNAFFYAKKSIELGRKNHKNYYQMALVYYTVGLLFSARTELERAMELKKQSYESDFADAKLLYSEIDNKIREGNITADNSGLLNDLMLNYCTLPQIQNGKIIRYIGGRGFGFIENSGIQYYFHISNVAPNQQKHVQEGAQVSFTPSSNEKGPTAKEIKIIN